ncbi:MAG: penicillin-binding protein [Pseudonocardiales bacterium]|jgi:peptidoglycan glycosyltransferase|nr:penicillin-binding protein [Pseudonocardiales bacterium]
MNRPIRKVAIALGVLLAAVFVNLNFVQVVQSDSLRNHSGNRRVLLAEYSSPRGQIVVQGTAVANSVATKDELKYLRRYSNGPLYAPVTGYNSFIYGTSGIEDAENNVLSGHDSRQFGRQIVDLFTGRDPRGGSVQLTINKAAQEAAYNAMKLPNGTFKRGAIVALDPTTGAILAAVSTPSYDPNQLSSHNSDAIQKYWAAQQPKVNPADPMLNRALNQTYPPGSVFKVIDSAAALESGVKPSTQIPAPNSYWPLGGSGPCPANLQAPCVQNFQGETCQNGTTASLEFALAKSCNTAFAELAVQKLGADKLVKKAQAFGLDGTQLSVPLPVAPSTIGDPNLLANDDAALAQTSFGQRDVRITPLQAAMISAAVANGGTLMKPYLVQQELSSDLSVLSDTKPQEMGQSVTPTVSQDLQQMMEAVVTAPEGTGGPAQITDIPNVVVGGKTGTADTGIFKNGQQTPPHAWFSGFALQNGNPKIAVAVVIENGGVSGDETTGGLAAAPVAKAVMEAFLKSPGGR